MKSTMNLRTGEFDRATRGGFTLVEMLVSVALVLLMMSMFAAIFQLAAESTSTQRGISENDQRARSVTTTLRSDFDKRTMRTVMPFQANEDANNTPTRFDDRTGFIEIITNDPANGIDDTLLLTVSADMVQKDADETPYFGRAEQLLDSTDTFDPLDSTNNTGNNIFVNSPNQPEMDDGVVTPNTTASSKAAQIAYSVRNGNLYRRVLLLREPRERAGRELNPQPTFQDGTDPLASAAYFTPDFYSAGTNAFWRDFDFSAIRVGGLAQLIGIESLNNAPGSTFFTLGKPHFRYGHSSTGGITPAASTSWSGGFPRRYTTIDSLSDTEFFGFFLQEETSYPSDVSVSPPTGGFTYPHGNAQLAGTTTPVGSSLPDAAEQGDPMDIRADISLSSRKLAAEFLDPTTEAGGSRRSEDLLLANVHEFRIEIWDDRLSEWVVPGHRRVTAGGVEGDYHIARRHNSGYGPFGPAAIARSEASDPAAATQWNFTNHVFDTWHPGAVSGEVGSATMPPFRAMELYPPFRPNGDLETQTTGATVLSSFWQESHSYSVGDVVFARTEDLNGDGDVDDTFSGTAEDGWYGSPANTVLNNEVYGSAASAPFGYGYYFKVVQAGDSADQAPNWQARDGALMTDDQYISGTVPAGVTPVVWQAVPNLRPLKAIRITVRFVDPSSKQMRQSTIIHSLVD